MIVIPALHPSREILVRVDALRPGAVHRATETHESVGGKPINVARFIRLMDGDALLIVRADPALRDALRADLVLGDGQADLVVVDSPVPSRTDLAIVDGLGETTPINGTAPRAPAEEIDAVAARALDGLGRGDVLVLAGSQPPGAEEFIPRLVRDARDRGAVAIVDASGPWLRDALAVRPDVVKINRDEAAGVDLGDVAILAITDGPAGIDCRIEGRAWRITPPVGLAVAGTLGAGDAVTAGLAMGLADGRAPLDAIRLGAAMAAARLRHVRATLDPADVPALERAIGVTPLD